MPDATPDKTKRAPRLTASVPPASTAANWAPDRSTKEIPLRIGRYELRAVLGEGAFGRVYRGYDTELHREVAIKVPHGVGASGEFRERFLREARAAAAVNHPNVCPIHDVGCDGDVLFLVMRFVPGGTLAGLLKSRGKPFAPRDAAAVVRKIALGVAAAHASDVIHRDLKPANVLWDDAGREVLVTDFGLARIGDETRLTVQGTVMGTPLYMAPEQITGDTAAIGPLADVYALGVILFEMLTGATPFRGTMNEIIGQKLAGDITLPSTVYSGIEPAMDALCLKAMGRSPESRFASAKELANALGDYRRGPVVVEAAETRPAATSATRVATPAPIPPSAGPPLPPSLDSEPVPERRQWPAAGETAAVPWESVVGSTMVRGVIETGAASRKRRTEVGGSTAKKKLWIGVGVAVLLLFVGMWASGVFKVKTKEGILVVEVNEPNAEVFVDGEKVTVTWDKGGKAEIRVKPGTRKVEVKKDGFKAFGEEVTLEEGKRRVMTARLVPPIKSGAVPRGPKEDAVATDPLIGGNVAKHEDSMTPGKLVLNIVRADGVNNVKMLELFIDGELKHKFEGFNDLKAFSLDLPPGKHTVALAKNSIEVYSREIDVKKPNDTTVLRIDLDDRFISSPPV